MYDRNDYDLRIEQHKQRAEVINGHAWKSTATLPRPAPRRTLAKLLLTLAKRLDPPAAVPIAEAAPSTPATL
jgi:hypothetical protein